MCLVKSILINLNSHCVKFQSCFTILYFLKIDKGFIDDHVMSIMILSVQYAFSSPVHLLPVA